eukprot:2911326-Pyramimonas_sp.AAC.1
MTKIAEIREHAPPRPCATVREHRHARGARAVQRRPTRLPRKPRDGPGGSPDKLRGPPECP